MVRSSLVIVAIAVGAGAWMSDQRQTAAGRGRAMKETREVSCVAPLGVGVKSARTFCDVIIATTGTGSVAMPIPVHTGTSKLLFDLHPRVQVVPGVTDPGLAFVRNAALVAIVRPDGTEIDRAAVVREYRTLQDLFDRVAGTGSDGYKSVAPGVPESIQITIPAGVRAIGIVGLRLEMMTRALRPAPFEAPGRPIAIVSNLRIEY